MAKIITAPGLGEPPPPADPSTVDGPSSSTGGEAPLPKARFGTDPRSAMSPEAALLRTVKPKAKAGVGGLRDKLQDATREDVRVAERNAALVRLKADRSEAPTVPGRVAEEPSTRHSQFPKALVAALVLVVGIVVVLVLRGRDRGSEGEGVPSPSAPVPSVAPTLAQQPERATAAPSTPPSPSGTVPEAPPQPSAPSSMPAHPKASAHAPTPPAPPPAAPPPSAAPAPPAPPDSSGPSPNPWKIKEHRT